MIKKEIIPGTDQVRVTFAVPSSAWAHQVHLVGEFNDWDYAATPMLQSRMDADWRVSVELKAGQCYRFRYLVDGKEWLNDWHSDGFLYETAPHGLCDSVVDLTQHLTPAPVALA